MSLGEVGGSWGILDAVLFASAVAASAFSSKKRMVRVRRDLRVGAKKIDEEE